MPTIAKCARCQRTYMVVGPRSGMMTVEWICPRCKRGRNLPDPRVPTDHACAAVAPESARLSRPV